MHELRPVTAPPTTLYCFNRSNYGFRMFRMDDDGQQQQPPPPQQRQQIQPTDRNKTMLINWRWLCSCPAFGMRAYTHTQIHMHTNTQPCVIVIERKAGSQRLSRKK